MNFEEKLGRKRTILISTSILLLNIYIVYLVSIQTEPETRKLISGGIRFLLTLGLLVMIYKGKKWAKIVGLILFSLGALGALAAFFAIKVALLNKVPFIVMFLIYTVAIIHFGFSNSFKAFYNYQNSSK